MATAASAVKAATLALELLVPVACPGAMVSMPSTTPDPVVAAEAAAATTAPAPRAMVALAVQADLVESSSTGSPAIPVPPESQAQLDRPDPLAVPSGPQDPRGLKEPPGSVRLDPLAQPDLSDP